MSEPLQPEVAIFNAALQLPAAQRASYLAAACGSDAALRRRVEVLLRAYSQAGAFLENPVLPPTEFEAARAGQDAGSAAKASPGAEQPSDLIGHYKLLQKIGEGGCGVVYMAEQEEPIRRRVALKVIKLGMDTRSVIARFDGERQALAMMDHPNIAKVLDAGATDAGRPYFVMELVRGLKITDFCDQHSLSTRARLDLLVLVCRAVQHAHQKGIIHRDLKPSNILVTINDGAPVPKVIDFGIAKATQGRLTNQTVFTAFEQFIGTPAYMSPEQAALSSLDVDTRSDIYSLGVLLYEVLTGQTPFNQQELLAAGLEEMRRMIREKEPPRPSTRLSALGASDLTTVARNRQSEPPRLIHSLNGDLDWIVMKCLEKERGRRYETANGLAMDIQRFLANEPILARPPGSLYRIQKLIRRNKLAFSAAAAVAAALVIGFAFSAWQFIEKSKAEREQSRLRQEAQRAQSNEAESRQQAERQELAARKMAYASDMKLLSLALDFDDLGRAQELLTKQRPTQGQQELRGWEWRYLWQFCQSDAAFTLGQQSNSIQSVSFSSDGAMLAVGTYLHDVTVWDVATRQPVFHAGGHHRFPARLAFGPQGGPLAFYNYTNGQANVVLWGRGGEADVRHLRLNGAVRDLAFARDGRLFTADLSPTNNITLWDIVSGTPLRRFTGRMPNYAMGNVFNIAPDGSQFARAIYGAANSVQVVELAGQTTAPFQAAEELTTALAFSPDGTVLATGGGYAEGAIKLWDVKTRKLIGQLDGHRSWVSSLKFLPDGRTLASASADRTVRLWDFLVRKPIRTLRGNRAELWTIDVSPDGRWLAGGGKDGSVLLWDLASTTSRPPPFRTLSSAGWWAFSPNGRSLGVIRRGQVKLYDPKTFELLSEPDFGFRSVHSFAFSPGGHLLVASDRAGKVAAWDMVSRQLVTNFTAHSNTAAGCGLSFLADGKGLLTFGADEMAKEWDTVSWSEIRQWPIANPHSALAVSPGTDLVATARQDGSMQLFSAREPQRRREFTGESRIGGLALSPDDKHLAATSENGTVELWDTRSLTRQALLKGALLGYHSVAISPDGARLAAGSNGQEAIKLWDLHSHEEVATLAGRGSVFAELEFSPDGDTIAARNWNGVIHFWTAPAWAEIEATDRARSEVP